MKARKVMGICFFFCFFTSCEISLNFVMKACFNQSTITSAIKIITASGRMTAMWSKRERTTFSLVNLIVSSLAWIFIIDLFGYMLAFLIVSEAMRSSTIIILGIIWTRNFISAIFNTMFQSMSSNILTWMTDIF